MAESNKPIGRKGEVRRQIAVSNLGCEQFTKPLPAFDKPPVTEVVLGVQFDPLKGFHTPQIGALWQEFKAKFPVVEERPPLEPTIERFGVARQPIEGIRFQMLDTPPIPRCWFLNNAKTELIQVQPDRFIRNWRKVDDASEYPRYDKTLRQAFTDDFKRFTDFVAREKLGELVPNQCEVTYVNLIVPNGVWQGHREAAKIVTVLCQRYSDDFLGNPEDASVVVRYVIPDADNKPIGRLHVSLDPAYRAKGNDPLFRLSLAARGQLLGSGIEGVLKFMDLGHEWVVRGFASITTKEMHAEWGRLK